MKRKRRRDADSAVQPCPFCAEPFEIYVDLSAGSQRFVEDCQVCCHPIDVSVEVEDGELLSVVVEQS